MLKRILTPLIITSLLIVPSVPAQAAEANKPNCPQWQELALKVGFKKKDLPTLDYIMWRESRCHTQSINKNLTKFGEVWSRDYGLTQINDYSWITYLRNKKIVRKSSDLLNPRVNLKAAKALYDYSSELKGGNPWRQWQTKEKYGFVKTAPNS